MTDPGTNFEAKLDRIDAIVKELESGNTKLDRAIVLFKEGKVLARECEELLKNAQMQIDEAISEPPSKNPRRNANNEEVDDQVPF
jgi:exodeoxyribonuclease VII small subunit